MAIVKNKNVVKLLELYKDVYALNYLSSLAGWDFETYMPPAAAEERGLVLAKLSVLKKKFVLSKKFKTLIKEAEKEKLNKYEKAIIRIFKEDYLDYYEKIPSSLLEELSKATSKAKMSWKKAKEKKDFSIFAPDLKRIIELNKKVAEKLGYEARPYNALLDLYEKDLTEKDLDALFSSLKSGLKRILKKVEASKKFSLKQHKLALLKYNKDRLHKFNLKLLHDLGYDFSRGRLDVSAHPFTQEIGFNDIRITTRYSQRDFASPITATIHEFGHALYELQQDERFFMTPLAGGVSLGWHESQSRFWENIVGRSYAFLKLYFKDLKKAVPGLKKYTVKDLYEYFNQVRPQPIRVEADELTYNMHIIVRYEIEKMFIDNDIDVRELPSIWNEKYESYLGIKIKNDSEGILQDIHWSLGSIGYFPTYSIGTIISASIKNRLETEVGKIPDLVKKKDFASIRSWLKENIHKYGSLYKPKDLHKKVFGTKEIMVEPYLNYLRKKYLKIYF